MVAPFVSIVIPAHDSASTLVGVLVALQEQDYPESSREILVVDDRSRDDTPRIAARFGARVITIAGGTSGPAAARNRGWKSAGGEIVLFLDSDCRPFPSWTRTLASALAGEPGTVAGGGYAFPAGLRGWARLPGLDYSRRHARLAGPVPFLGSFNLAVPRSALKATGGFDERFPAPSAEDNDFSYRLDGAGYRLRFLPGSCVEHLSRPSLARNLWRQARHGFYRARLYARHPRYLRGDGYSTWRDFAAVPLALLFLPAWLYAAPAGLALLAAWFALQFPMMRHLAALREGGALLRWPFFSLLRDEARGIGWIAGMAALPFSRPPSSA